MSSSRLCFFKQKAAYESEYGLVGSEMCIRDGDGARSVLQERYGIAHATLQV